MEEGLKLHHEMSKNPHPSLKRGHAVAIVNSFTAPGEK